MTPPLYRNPSLEPTLGPPGYRRKDETPGMLVGLMLRSDRARRYGSSSLHCQARTPDLPIRRECSLTVGIKTMTGTRLGLRRRGKTIDAVEAHPR